MALLPGCGFAPLYADGAAATQLTGRIDVASIGGLMGFEMRRHLTDRLDHRPGARFRLTVTMQTRSEALAITPQAEITRYTLTGTATYRLADTEEGDLAASGSVRAFAAYSANDAPIATRAAERDARLRLAAALADQIVGRIAADATGILS